MKEEFQNKINETFLKVIEKLAYSITVPKEGYRWETKYVNDLVELTYTNGDVRNSCYIDFVENKCINGDNNHMKDVCEVTELIFRILS